LKMSNTPLKNGTSLRRRKTFLKSLNSVKGQFLNLKVNFTRNPTQSLGC
jgi:hypothetical protein